MPMIDGGAWVRQLARDLLRVQKEFYLFKPQPEDRRMYLFEIRITTSDGYVGRKVTAPSAAHVIAHLAEEDEDFLTDPTIQSIEVKRA
jgi:hypothetical protein